MASPVSPTAARIDGARRSDGQPTRHWSSELAASLSISAVRRSGHYVCSTTSTKKDGTSGRRCASLPAARYCCPCFCHSRKSLWRFSCRSHSFLTFFAALLLSSLPSPSVRGTPLSSQLP